ncbi:MAG: hypothetical protein GC151_13730 [Betaproteobacteria bacterium]|nr:hypothetical protein [Betaproteobacteria bacterium]
MIRGLLMLLTARLAVREIRGDKGEPYLERYHVVAIGPVRVSIHRFLASDPDRGTHSHPWHALSIILSGRYTEIKLVNGRPHILTRRWANVLRPSDFHRVIVPYGVREVWTLFIHGPRIAGWGFMKNGAYRPVTTTAQQNPWGEWWKSAPRGRNIRDTEHREAA